MTRIIAHVPRRLSTAAQGGTEQVLANLLPWLAAQGFQQRLLTTTCLEPERQGRFAGFAVERYPFFYPVWPLGRQARMAMDGKGGNLVSFGLAQAVRRLPDLALVHLHTAGRLGAQVLRAAIARRVPCLLTLHGGHFAIPPAEQEALAPRHRFRLEWGRMLSCWWKTRHLLTKVDAVVCVGIEEYQAACQALPGRRVRLIPGGVDAERFTHGSRTAGRTWLGCASDRKLLLCPARLDAHKDQATLVEAWKSLATPGLDLALVGVETTPGYARQLQAQARGAPGRLLCPGNCPPERMPDCYAAADLVVLPSRHEPFGLVCLEAWAASVALVAAAVGGPAWLLADGGGALFPPGDVQALARLIRNLLDDDGRRQVLIAAGSRRVAEFSWKRQSDRYLELYRDIGLAL